MTTRQSIAVNALGVSVVVAVGILLLATMRDLNDRLRSPSLPIEIEQSVITAKNPALCPGDLLQWKLAIRYNDAPLLMEINRHVRNLETGALEISVQERLTVPQEDVGTFDRDALWIVPGLHPGRYRLITTTTSVVGGDLLQYYVDFRVREDCVE